MEVFFVSLDPSAKPAQVGFFFRHPYPPPPALGSGRVGGAGCVSAAFDRFPVCSCSTELLFRKLGKSWICARLCQR